MPACFFASDLHGRAERYDKLFDAIRSERPAAVFLGGDLLPSALFAAASEHGVPGADFVRDVLADRLTRLRRALGADSPVVFAVLGNDDARCEEDAVAEVAEAGLWEYLHARRVEWAGYRVYGYACVPPTPFLLKDWERYDVSRFVDPGCVAPEDGIRTVAAPDREIAGRTIQGDLDALAGADDLARSIWLFHSPPYRTVLDRAALDGQAVDYAPLDVHVGSIAIRRFIEARQPLVTLHGHVHESARLTGSWREQIGRTWALGAAHDGPELALVRFDPDAPHLATRELI